MVNPFAESINAIVAAKRQEDAEYAAAEQAKAKAKSDALARQRVDDAAWFNAEHARHVARTQQTGNNNMVDPRRQWELSLANPNGARARAEEFMRNNPGVMPGVPANASSGVQQATDEYNAAQIAQARAEREQADYEAAQRFNQGFGVNGRPVDAAAGGVSSLYGGNQHRNAFTAGMSDLRHGIKYGVQDFFGGSNSGGIRRGADPGQVVDPAVAAFIPPPSGPGIDRSVMPNQGAVPQGAAPMEAYNFDAPYQIPPTLTPISRDPAPGYNGPAVPPAPAGSPFAGNIPFPASEASPAPVSQPQEIRATPPPAQWAQLGSSLTAPQAWNTDEGSPMISAISRDQALDAARNAPNMARWNAGMDAIRARSAEMEASLPDRKAADEAEYIRQEEERLHGPNLHTERELNLRSRQAAQNQGLLEAGRQFAGEGLDRSRLADAMARIPGRPAIQPVETEADARIRRGAELDAKLADSPLEERMAAAHAKAVARKAAQDEARALLNPDQLAARQQNQDVMRQMGQDRQAEKDQFYKDRAGRIARGQQMAAMRSQAMYGDPETQRERMKLQSEERRAKYLADTQERISGAKHTGETEDRKLREKLGMGELEAKREGVAATKEYTTLAKQHQAEKDARDSQYRADESKRRGDSESQQAEYRAEAKKDANFLAELQLTNTHNLALNARAELLGKRDVLGSEGVELTPITPLSPLPTRDGAPRPVSPTASPTASQRATNEGWTKPGALLRQIADYGPEEFDRRRAAAYAKLHTPEAKARHLKQTNTTLQEAALTPTAHAGKPAGRSWKEYGAEGFMVGTPTAGLGVLPWALADFGWKNAFGGGSLMEDTLEGGLGFEQTPPEYLLRKAGLID